MKVIVVSDNFSLSEKLKAFTLGVAAIEMLGVFPSGIKVTDAIKKLNPDFVIMEPNIAYDLNAVKNQIKATAAVRQHLSASTHHGIQLLPVASVYYFQAEHKYVIARHENGELLIDDSLASLEKEFADLFVRVHRKILVAKSYIKALEKTSEGNWQIVLTNNPDKLIVSRRQLAVVRKYINAYASS